MVQTLSTQNELTLMWLKFLQDLQNLQPDAAFMLEHYAWFLPLSKWPEHSPYLKPINFTHDAKLTQNSLGSTSALPSNYLLRVDKPRMSACPHPEPNLAAWLKPTWDDCAVLEPEFYTCKLHLKLPVAQSLVHLFHVEQSNSEVDFGDTKKPASQESAQSLAKTVAAPATTTATTATTTTTSQRESQSKPLSFGEFQVLNGASPFFGATSLTQNADSAQNKLNQDEDSFAEDVPQAAPQDEDSFAEDVPQAAPQDEIVVLDIVRYTSNPEWIEALKDAPSSKVTKITFFAEQEALQKDLQTWSRQRKLWQQVRSAEQIAGEIYTKLQLAYTSLQLSSGQVELLLGNGLLRAVYKDKEAERLLKSSALDNPFEPSQGEFDFARNLVIAHPVLLKPVRLCFDERLESFTLYDSNLPCHIYQPALQALDALASLEHKLGSRAHGSNTDSSPSDLTSEHASTFDLALELPTLEEQASLVHPLERTSLVKFLELLGSKLPRCLVTPQESLDLSLLTNYTCMLSFSPCLIMQSLTPYIKSSLASLIDKVARGAQLSAPAMQLITLDSRATEGEHLGKSTQLLSISERIGHLGAERLDLLLSCELNPQQLKVVEKATSKSLVVAQAPIGSGKSYTAAALVGQAIAQGKSVLVTSACQESLNEVASYLKGEVSLLCGRLGSQGAEAMAHTLQSLACFNLEALNAEISSLKERRDSAFQELLEQRTKLFNWLNSENIEIVFQGNSYTCRQLTSFVKEHADLAQIIPFTPNIERTSAQSKDSAQIALASQPFASGSASDTDADTTSDSSAILGTGAVCEQRFELDALPLSLDELKALYTTNESVPAQYEEQLKLTWPELKALPQPEQFLDLLQTLSKLQQSLDSSQVWQLELNLAHNLVAFKTRTPAAQAIFGAQVELKFNELKLSKVSSLAIGQFAEIPTWIAEVYKIGQAPNSPQFKAWHSLTQRLMNWHELSCKVSLQLEGRKFELNPQWASNAQAMQQLEAALQCACKYESLAEQANANKVSAQGQGEQGAGVRAESGQEAGQEQVAEQGQVRPEQFKAACHVLDRALCLNKQGVRGLKKLTLALDYVRLQLIKQQSIQQWQSLVTPISKVSFESLDSDSPEKAAWRFGYLLHFVLHWRVERNVVQELWQSKYRSLGLDLDLNLQSADPKSQSLQGAVMVWHILQQAGQELVFLTQQAHRYYRYCISYNRVLKLLNQEQYKLNPCCCLLLQALSQRQPPLYAKAYRQMCQILEYKETYELRHKLLERLAFLAPDWSEAIAVRRKEHGKATVPSQVEVAWQYWQFAQCLAQITSGSPLSIKQQLVPLKHKFYEISAQYVDKLSKLQVLTHLSHLDLSATGLSLPCAQDVVLDKQGKMVLSADLLRSLEHWPELPNKQSSAFELLPAWLLPWSFVLNKYESFHKRFDLLVIDEAQALTLSASSLLLFNLAEHVVLLGDEQQLSLTPSVLLNVKAQELLAKSALADITTPTNSLDSAKLTVALKDLALLKQSEVLAQAYPEQISKLKVALLGNKEQSTGVEDANQASQEGQVGQAGQASAQHVLSQLSSLHGALYPWLQSFMTKLVWTEQFTCVPQLFNFGNQHGYGNKLQGLRLPRFSTLTPSLVMLQGGKHALHILTALLQACGEQNEYASRSMGVMVLGELPLSTKLWLQKQLGLNSSELKSSLSEGKTVHNEEVVISTLELLSCLVYAEVSVSLQKQHHLRVGTPEFFSGQSCDVMFVVLGEGQESALHYNMAIMHTNEQLWLINAGEIKSSGVEGIYTQLVNYAEKSQAEFAQDLQDESSGEEGASDGKLAQRSAMHTAQALVQALAKDCTLTPEQISFMQQLVGALSEHGFQLLLSQHIANAESTQFDDPTAIVVVYQQRHLRLECHTEQELLHPEGIIEVLQRHERYEHYGYSVLHVMCSRLDEGMLEALILQIQREGFQSENLRGFIYVLLHQSSVVLLHKIQERALSILAQSFALDFAQSSLFAGPMAKSLSRGVRSAQTQALASALVKTKDNSPVLEQGAGADSKSAERKVALSQLAKDLSDYDLNDKEANNAQDKTQTKQQSPKHQAQSEPDIGDYADYIADNLSKEQSLTSELERVVTQSEQEQAEAAYQAGPERKRIGEKAEAETELKYNYQLARIGLKQIEQPIENPLPADPHERFRAFKRFLFGMLRQMRLSYKDLLSSYQIVAVTPNAGQTQYFLRLCEYLHLRPYIFNSSKPMAKRVWCIKQSDLMSSYVHESALALCANSSSAGEEQDELDSNQSLQEQPMEQYSGQNTPNARAYQYAPPSPRAAVDENSPLISALNKALNPYWGQTVDDRERALPETMRALAQRGNVDSWEMPRSTNQFLKEQLMPPPMRRNLNRGDVNTLAVLSMIPKEQSMPTPSKARIHTLRVTKGKGSGAGDLATQGQAPRRGAVQYAKTSGQGKLDERDESAVEQLPELEQDRELLPKQEANQEAHQEADQEAEVKDSALGKEAISDSQLQAAVQQLKQVQRQNDGEFALSSIFDIPEVSSAVSASIAAASNMLSAQEQVGGASQNQASPTNATKPNTYAPERPDKAHQGSFPVYGAGAAANSRLKRAGAVDYPGMPQEGSSKAQDKGQEASGRADSKQAALNSATAAARARLAEQKAQQSGKPQRQLKIEVGQNQVLGTSTPAQGESTPSKPERFNADAAVAELLMRYEQEQGQEATQAGQGARVQSPVSPAPVKRATPLTRPKARKEQESSDNVVVRGSVMGIGEIEGEMQVTPSPATSQGAYTSATNSGYGSVHPASNSSHRGALGTNNQSAYRTKPQVNAASLAGAQALSQAAYGGSAYRGKTSQGYTAPAYSREDSVQGGASLSSQSQGGSASVSRGTVSSQGYTGQAGQVGRVGQSSRATSAPAQSQLSADQAGYLAMLLQRSQIWFKQEGAGMQVKVLPSQDAAFKDICKAMKLAPRLKASSQGMSRYSEWIF